MSAKVTSLDLVKEQPHDLPILITAKECTGSTYIVTGANVGLGLEAAKKLVALGAAKVIMAVRNISAGEKAKAEIEEETGRANVAEVWTLDLASYESVKAFAKKATSELERIDALIENAAVAQPERVLAEGRSINVTVNVISTFLLAVLLLPKMRQSAQQFSILPHLAIVNSANTIDFEEAWNKIKDDPLVKMEGEDASGATNYPLSKVMGILAVHHLKDLIPVARTGVVLNAVDPGLCKTSLARHTPEAHVQFLTALYAQYGRTAEVGSRNLLYAANAGTDSHGRFLSSCRIAEDILPDWLKDEEAEKHVWEVIAHELEAIEPGCVKRILE